MNVGDKVTLSKDSEFYDATGEDEFNPFGVIGTVTKVAAEIPESSLNIMVDWGYYSKTPYQRRVMNAYNPEDLVVVE